MSDFSSKTPPEPCNPEIFERGVSILVLPSLSMHRCEHWVGQIRTLSGAAIDWHYAGGRNNILVLPEDAEKAMNTARALWLGLWELFKDQHGEDHYSQSEVKHFLGVPE